MKLRASLTIIFCTICLSYLSSQQIRYSNNGDFVLEGLALPDTVAKAENKPYWRYFWEFGDSHYSADSAPSGYYYDRSQDYNVRLTLIPHYSYNNTRVIKKTIRGIPRDNQIREYTSLEQNKLVSIVTSARNELVPKNEIRVAMHYRLPANSRSDEGYVFLFFNNQDEIKKLDLDFLPLRFLAGSEALYEAQGYVVEDLFSMPGVTANAATLLDGLMEEYNQSRVYLCKLQPGEEKRLFVSLQADEALDSTIISEKESLTTFIQAVWIPKNTDHISPEMTDKYKLVFLPVHDPNKLKITKPRGRATYHSKKSERFHFEIQFENKGGRAARHVDIEMPWHKNMNYETIDVIERDPSLEDCRVCPPDFDRLTSPRDFSCFNIDTSQVSANNTVYFSFNNIGLKGKKEPGLSDKKYTKGKLKFSVESNSKAVNIQRHHAYIKFYGGEIYKTNTKKKKWKHKSLSLRGGKTIMGDMGRYDYLGDNMGRYYNIGLVYKNVALRQGLGYGLELSSAGLGFDGRSAQLSGDQEIGLQLTRDIVDLKTVDLQFQLENRAFGALAIGGGIGLSIPLSASGVLSHKWITDSSVYEELETSSLEQIENSESLFNEVYSYEGIETDLLSEFGLLESKDQNDVFSQSTIGGIASVYAEFGSLRNYTIGARYNFRIYPDSYREKCLKIFHGELYVRLRLQEYK